MIFLVITFILGSSFHLFFTFTSAFYIFPEISLYPYLITKGLTPYTQLIDQHFPAIFFGPFNLSFFSITTPTSALYAYLAVLLLTNLGALLLINKKLSQKVDKLLVFAGFIITYILLSSGNFWLESFILLFLIWGLYLFFHPSSWAKVISGLLFGLALGTRPTLLLFFAILVYQKRKSLGSSFILASALYPLSQLIWLTANQLWPSFLQLMQFNSSFYISLSSKAPNFNHLIITLLVLLLVFIVHKKDQLVLLLIFFATLSIGAYPRFELIHLLPAALTILILLPSKVNKKLLLGWVALSLSLLVYIHPFKSINFFNPSSLQTTAAQIESKTNLDQLYILGGPDQLYQLTNSTPTGNIYLPSLPWYHANPDFVQKQINALKNNPQAPVIINTQSSLGGVGIKKYASSVLQYVYQNYQMTDSVGPLHIYKSADAIN